MATVKKLLVVAITLMVLGLTAAGFGVVTFTTAADHEAKAERLLDRADEEMAQALAAPADAPEGLQHDDFLFLANSSTRSAAQQIEFAEQWTLQTWLFAAGAVILIGSGALVLRAHRRRAAGASADATATQVIHHL
jgi:hypothetical protein